MVQPEKPRSKIRIYMDILQAVQEDGMAKPTHILQKANLSHDRLTKYLGELVQKKLVKENQDATNRYYTLSEHGIKIFGRAQKSGDFRFRLWIRVLRRDSVDSQVPFYCPVLELTVWWYKSNFPDSEKANSDQRGLSISFLEQFSHTTTTKASTNFSSLSFLPQFDKVSTAISIKKEASQIQALMNDTLHFLKELLIYGLFGYHIRAQVRGWNPITQFCTYQ